MLLAMALAEAKSLYRRAIRACRALPVRHIDAKLELNVKIAAHYLIRRERDGPSEELLQQGKGRWPPVSWRGGARPRAVAPRLQRRAVDRAR